MVTFSCTQLARLSLPSRRSCTVQLFSRASCSVCTVVVASSRFETQVAVHSKTGKTYPPPPPTSTRAVLRKEQACELESTGALNSFLGFSRVCASRGEHCVLSFGSMQNFTSGFDLSRKGKEHEKALLRRRLQSFLGIK